MAFFHRFSSVRGGHPVRALHDPEQEILVTTTTTRLLTTCAAAALALGLAACGGTSTPSTSAAPASSAAAAAPTDSEDESATADEADETASAGAKVSANTASEEEIAAALESAGVSNADRWAEAVVEYRPYPTDDPNLTKLRDNLAKYNTGQETTDKIVSSLTPCPARRGRVARTLRCSCDAAWSP